MNYLTEFKIQQLRTKNLTAAIESIAVVLGAVITNMLVPQLLIKYVYDPTTLTEAPAIFELLPLITYGIALAYFAYAMVNNFLRSRKANNLEQELLVSGTCCSDGSCSCEGEDGEEISEEELKELERIVDEALKPAAKKVNAKGREAALGQKATKKTAKKSSKKKASKKAK